MCSYLSDGGLKISNNLAERSVKPFIMGRRDLLLANTPSGACGSRILHSLAETSKVAGAGPYPCLASVMATAPLLDLLLER